MEPPAKPVRTRRSWLQWVLLGALGVAGIMLIAETSRVYGGLNEHTIVPDRVYRVAQPSEEQILELAERHGIRTVLNLRGTTPWDPWYQEECRGTCAADVSQEDVTLSAQTLPFPTELKRVIEVLDQTQYPVLIHCKQGADRTGLVAAMVMLLYTDATLDEARRQLLPRYGHWPVARTVNIDRFFDLYEQKLASEGKSHTSQRFRHWVLHEYCPGPARSYLTWEHLPPRVVAANTPFTMRLRCENCSDTPWQMTPGTFAGIHISYAVYTDTPPAVWEGRAGLRFEAVLPGESTTVPIPVSGLPAGMYRLVAELHDATGAAIPFRTQSFTKYGNASIVAEFRVQ